MPTILDCMVLYVFGEISAQRRSIGKGYRKSCKDKKISCPKASWHRPFPPPPPPKICRINSHSTSQSTPSFRGCEALPMLSAEASHGYHGCVLCALSLVAVRWSRTRAIRSRGYKYFYHPTALNNSGIRVRATHEALNCVLIIQYMTLCRHNYT